MWMIIWVTFRDLSLIKKLNRKVVCFFVFCFLKKITLTGLWLQVEIKAFAENQISESSGKVTSSGLGIRVI